MSDQLTDAQVQAIRERAERVIRNEDSVDDYDKLNVAEDAIVLIHALESLRNQVRGVLGIAEAELTEAIGAANVDSLKRCL